MYNAKIEFPAARGCIAWDVALVAPCVSLLQFAWCSMGPAWWNSLDGIGLMISARWDLLDARWDSLDKNLLDEICLMKFAWWNLLDEICAMKSAPWDLLDPRSYIKESSWWNLLLLNGKIWNLLHRICSMVEYAERNWLDGICSVGNQHKGTCSMKATLWNLHNAIYLIKSARWNSLHESARWHRLAV